MTRRRTMRLGLASTLAILALAAPAAAEEPDVQMSIVPWEAYDGVERPYRFIVTMTTDAEEPLEVVADRRLLSFELRTEGRGRRRHRCRYSRAPRTVRRAHRLESEDGVWREWIDLRMYCWGRALRALDGGAEVRPRYGWRRASRRRWIARDPDARRRDWVGGVDVEPFEFPERPEEERSTRRLDVEEGEEAEAPIEVELSPRSARSGRGLLFRVSVRAAEGSERVYVRPDAFSFNVRSPDGGEATRCSMPRGGGSPPPDLFRRIRERRGTVSRLDASQFCPDDTFERAGVYEVVPKLRLDHGGEEWELGAVTGRYAGPATPVRILSGSAGYVVQEPRRADEEEGSEEDRP